MHDELTTRWGVAIHEAGHLVVGMMLASDPTEVCAAHLSINGAGLAMPPVNLNADDNAVMIACGPVAAELLRHLPPPMLPPPVIGQPAAGTQVYPCHLPDGNEVAIPPECVSDEVAVARNCIEGVERAPWLWMKNHATLMAHASRLVIKHTPEILLVAERVFVSGLWIGDRNSLDKLAHVAPTTAAQAAQTPALPAERS